MTIHRIPEMRCLACDQLLNHASDNETATAPSVGDYTYCLYCHHLMVFDKDLRLREMTVQEEIDSETDPAVAEIREFVEFYAHMTGKGKKH